MYVECPRGSIMQFCFVYITTGTLEEAREIGGKLVEEHLAACANLLPQMESIYSWKGEIHRDQEVVLIAKTNSTLLKSLTDRVKELHSYECPCVVAIPVDGGNPDYFSWLSDQLHQKE